MTGSLGDITVVVGSVMMKSLCDASNKLSIQGKLSSFKYIVIAAIVIMFLKNLSFARF